MTPRETLEAARSLIAHPDRWTDGESARRADGTPVEPDDPHACQWCALGALAKITPDHGSAGYLALVDRLAEATGGAALGTDASLVIRLNDYQGHKAVLGMYDRAIAVAA